MRCWTFVLPAVLMSGCIAPRDPYVTNDDMRKAGDWQIAGQLDRVTGATLPSATVVAFASSTFADNPSPASLQLSCFEGRPIVRFAFQFKMGADRNAALGYRFDDKPGRDNVEARILAGQQVVVIENPAAVAQFIEDLGGAKKVYVRLRSLTSARTTAEFPLAGSDEAMKAAFADCPLPVWPALPAVTAAPARRTS